MAAAIPGILKACAFFDMVVGTMHVAYGQYMLADRSVFVVGSENSALADSQIRFGGAIMASSGVLAWWASNDISRRQVPLAILGVGVFAGGCGRFLAGNKHGFGRNMKTLMLVEMVVPVVVYLFGNVADQW
jgi:hypothetical protein